MPFWNNLLTLEFVDLSSKNICSKCKLPFANDDADYDLGLVVQCPKYKQYCVSCCP